MTSVVIGAALVATAALEASTQGKVVVNGVGFAVSAPLCADAGFWTAFPPQFRVAPSMVFHLSWQFKCVALGPGNGSSTGGPSYVARSVTSTTAGFTVLSTTLPSAFGYQQMGSVTVTVRAPGWPGFYPLEFVIGGTTAP